SHRSDVAPTPRSALSALMPTLGPFFGWLNACRSTLFCPERSRAPFFCAKLESHQREVGMRLRWGHGCWITAFATLVFGCYTPLLAQKGAGGAAGGAGSGNPPASIGGAGTRGTTGPV